MNALADTNLRQRRPDPGEPRLCTGRSLPLQRQPTSGIQPAVSASHWFLGLISFGEQQDVSFRNVNTDGLLAIVRKAKALP